MNNTKNQLYKFSLAHAISKNQRDLWCESRRMNALAKTDIEILTMGANEARFEEHLIDVLIENFGLERILYILCITVRWGNRKNYSAENLDWLQEMVEMHSLCWDDESGLGGFDCQSALALNNNAAYAWNILLT